jgi:hypothetical protein
MAGIDLHGDQSFCCSVSVMVLRTIAMSASSNHIIGAI